MASGRPLFPNPVHETSVHRAWESVVRGEHHAGDTLRALVDRSWQRCMQAQVDPNRKSGPLPVSSEGLAVLHEQQSEMLEASGSIMALARDYLSETGSIMILADASGTILASEGDHLAKDSASAIHLMPGARWTEALCGTNAIGTALEIGEPVQIHSSEHFCAGIKRWTCAATVVRHPAGGEILGALDVSGLSSTFSRQALALAVTTAKRIESKLAMTEMERRYRLLEASLTRWSSADDCGAVLFDRRGAPVKANAYAQAAISAAGGRIDWLIAMQRLPELAQWRHAHTLPARLPFWLRPEWLHPVMVQGQWLGTLLQVPWAGPGRPKAAPAAAAQRAATPGADVFDRLVHGTGAMQDVIRRARQLSSARTAVLLQGETGAGKEEFARGLHGERRGAYVAVNCGGLARDLLASELFGHAEGAFTGARKGGMAGKIEAAQGGTLFLDEIGEMPLDMQPMLLRVLEQGEVYRLGENTPRKVDFRLVAATHRNLREEVTAGRFRMDLYYRIAVTSLRIPPLRDRPGDVTLLAQHYLAHFRQQAGQTLDRLPEDVADCLSAYAWPGNVRELRNVMEAAVLMSGGGPLNLDCMPDELRAGSAGHVNVVTGGAAPALVTASAQGACTLEQAEAQAIRAAVDTQRGNLTQAARQLGIAKSTLYAKMKQYGLQR